MHYISIKYNIISMDTNGVVEKSSIFLGINLKQAIL